MRWLCLAMGFSFCASTWADHPGGKEKKPAVLLEGLGSVHHPVATKNPEAQKFFDQGLRLMYAFNHDEAHRAFAKAAELDPKLAMAHWGMALAVGPNYNLDAEELQLKAAYASVQKAVELAKDGPEHERAYVAALAERYAADPKKADKKQLAQKYAQAMKALSQRYPDDLDAATLYAESMMNLRPWELWNLDGKAAEGTEEIVAVLEGVLRRHPDHTGANHYYIHAVEASRAPERALPAADRLRDLQLQTGHLVHMPSHIYIRVGDYEAAAVANEKAAAVDAAYIKKFNVQGVYPLMYYSHNLHFLAVARAFQGRGADAKKAADQLAAHIQPHVPDMPMLEFFLPTPTLIQVRFAQWDEILAAREPDAKLTIVKAVWHYARGRALLAKEEPAKALEEWAAMVQLVKAMPEDLKYGDRNLAKKVLLIPALVLDAKLQLANKDVKKALALLEEAARLEDQLNYIEPADWYLPVRETLGAVHLGLKDGAAAEKVFRADLERNRRNPRSLSGLMESLHMQGREVEAGFVRQEFERAWQKGFGKLDWRQW